MTKSFSFVVLSFAIFLSACSNDSVSHLHKQPLHIDIEAPGFMYQKLLAESQIQVGALDLVVKMGERNLAWLSHINERILSEEKLSFSSKSTMTGYPMDQPSRYSEKRVLAQFETAQKEMPREMYAVLIEGQPFTDQPPLDVEEYLAWGLKIDKIYQSGTRWLLMQPYLAQYKRQRKQDIRGYYFLSIEPNLDSKLAQFSQLSQEDQARLSEWLIQLCFNTHASIPKCKTQLERNIKGNDVPYFYRTFNSQGKRLFNWFFTLNYKRSDIVWNSSNENQIDFPFRDPRNSTIADFLKYNLEDEWKWENWKLMINFLPKALTHMVFEAGTTPHVDRLAGNIITMDANAPLTEYDVQWTIRHEFGHVLGFPDCYIEFYEEETGDMVNYQIDTSNLMCSRMGALQEKHYHELKRAYFK